MQNPLATQFCFTLFGSIPHLVSRQRVQLAHQPRSFAQPQGCPHHEKPHCGTFCDRNCSTQHDKRNDLAIRTFSFSERSKFYGLFFQICNVTCISVWLFGVVSVPPPFGEHIFHGHVFRPVHLLKSANHCEGCHPDWATKTRSHHLENQFSGSLGRSNFFVSTCHVYVVYFKNAWVVFFPPNYWQTKVYWAHVY